MSEARAFLLTPAGRGAVATLGVHGPQAWNLVAAHFRPVRPSGTEPPPVGRVLYGHWPLGITLSVQGMVGDPPEPSAAALVPAEEVVVCRTAADTVEIHCHGGERAWRAIAATLHAAGCETGNWREAANEFCVDPFVAEAAVALAEAVTVRTAALLLDQYQGALSRAMRDLRHHLVQGEGKVAIQIVAELLGWTRLGLHLTRPFTIVLAGLPNVGKSSLMNRLTGFERSIVLDLPGTTRDVVTQATAIDGWPVELSDTAGLRASGEVLETAGIAAATQHMAAADVLVAVLDASEPASAQEDALLSAWPQAMRVYNKCDLPTGRSVSDGVCVSARTGAGLDALLSAIARRLVPRVPPPGQAIPFLPRHVELLRRVEAIAATGDYAAAARELGPA